MENTIIQASAGTGKTHQLACRYLLLLFSGVRPENILATTFTKKAAGEILNRILTWLAIGATNETKCAELANALTRAKELTQDNDKTPVELSLDKVRSMLYEVIKSLNRVNISTLDSYFNQLAQCFSLELKLPMDWQIIEDSQDKAYRQNAMSSMFEDEKVVHRYTQFLESSELNATVYKQMSSNIDRMYSLWREAPAKAWDALQVPTQSLLKEDEFQELLNHTISQLESDAIFTDHEKEKHVKELESLRNPKTRFEAATRMAEHALMKSIVNATPESGIVINKKRSVTPQNDPETFSCLVAVANYVHAYILDVWKKQSDFYRDTLQIFDSLYTDAKKKAGLLKFEDIPCFLSQQKFADRKIETSFRMDSSVEHLMLDEFQDTSLDQWRVLEALAQKTSHNANCSFFCVGDSKQAIYNWRGGEAQLLVTLGEKLNISEKDMIKSFRSKPVILQAVNEVFQNIDSNPALADYADLSGGKPIWGRSFIKHECSKNISSQKDNDLYSYVELRTAPYSEDADEEEKKHIDSLRSTTYKYIAENIIQKLHKDAEKLNLEIGVLVRKNESGSEIADCIKKLGIECSLEGKTILLDSFEVCQILALLKWIDHPGDVYSYYVVSQSALAEPLGIKDRWKTSQSDNPRIVIPVEDCKILNQIRHNLFRDGYGLTIQRWVKTLKPEANERSRRRLEMLEDLANKFDSQGSTRTDDFIEYINSASVQNAYKTRIRIMTYHQSKGLQFDVVVLPDLDVDLVNTDSDPVVYGRETPVDLPNEIVRSVNEKCRFLLPPHQQKLFTDVKLRTLQESLCNLYVAMTRAKRTMYMVLSPPKIKGDSSKTYGGVVLGALAPNETKEADKVYYAAGDPNWIQNMLIKAGAESSQNANQKPNETTSDNVVKVSSEFHFRPGGSSICVPLPATAWKPNVKETSFIETVTARIDASAKTGVSLPQNLRGTLFHYWLADIECLDKYRVDDQRLKELGIEIGLQESSFTGYLAPFRSLLNQPAVISALTRPDASWDVYREKNVAAILDASDNSGNQYLVSGVLDRLTVHRTQGRVDEAHVVDFKTVPNGVKTAEVRVQYAGQMDAYRQIVSKMYNIPLNKVKITLLILEGDY